MQTTWWVHCHHHETASPLFQAGFLAFVSRFHEEPRGLAWSVYKGHEVEMVWGWFFFGWQLWKRGETAVSLWLVAGSPGKAEERLVPFVWQLHRERRERFRQKKGEGCASKGEWATISVESNLEVSIRFLFPFVVLFPNSPYRAHWVCKVIP